MKKDWSDVLGVVFGFLICWFAWYLHGHILEMGIESDLDFWIVMGLDYAMIACGIFSIAFGILGKEIHACLFGDPETRRYF